MEYKVRKIERGLKEKEERKFDREEFCQEDLCKKVDQCKTKSHDKFWIGILCAVVFGLFGVVIGFTYLEFKRESFFNGFRKGLVVNFILAFVVILALGIYLSSIKIKIQSGI